MTPLLTFAGGKTRTLRRYFNTLSFLSFAIIALLPTAVAGAYYMLIASDQYAVESRLALRMSGSGSGSTASVDLIAQMFSSKPVSDVGNDTYVVSNFLRSRNIVEELNRDGFLRRIYSRPQIDYFSRFKSDGSDDELWSYFQHRMVASVDRLSGVLTVTAIAFTPEDSLELANRLLDQTTKTVNQYSARMRSDFVGFAKSKMNDAAHEYRARLIAVRNFQDLDHVIDPQQEAVATGKSLSSVQLSRASLEREKAAAERTLSPDAPTVRILAARIAALDEQIKQLQSQLTSTDEARQAATATLAKFDELNLKRDFAEKLFGVAKQTYQQALLDAERQRTYLVLFVKPQLPDEAAYPRPLANTSLVFLFATLLWGLGRLTVAGVSDALGLD